VDSNFPFPATVSFAKLDTVRFSAGRGRMLHPALPLSTRLVGGFDRAA
jgi:hypothetical protein